MKFICLMAIVGIGTLMALPENQEDRKKLLPVNKTVTWPPTTDPCRQCPPPEPPQVPIPCSACHVPCL